MPTLALDMPELVSTVRSAPLNGAASSADYNDSQRENLLDLASLHEFVLNNIVPLVQALSSTALPLVGIEGRTVFTDTSDTTELCQNAVTSAPLTLAESLRFLQALIQNMRGDVDAATEQVKTLASRLAASGQVDLAKTIQAFSESMGRIASTQASQQTAISNLQTNQGKTRAVRVTTGSVTNGSTADVDVDFPNGQEFGDNNFTVSIAVQDATHSLTVEGFDYNATAGKGVVVHVVNGGGAPVTGTLHVTAVHD